MQNIKQVSFQIIRENVEINLEILIVPTKMFLRRKTELMQCDS